MKRSIFVFLTLIFLSPSVFAVDYYWTRSGTSTPQIIDPVADCRALDPSSSYSYHSHSFAGATGQSMTCRFQRTSDGNLGGADYYYNRNGSTCPIDTTYNQQVFVKAHNQPFAKLTLAEPFPIVKPAHGQMLLSLFNKAREAFSMALSKRLAPLVAKFLSFLQPAKSAPMALIPVVAKL
jgi:hypothetical protein